MPNPLSDRCWICWRRRPCDGRPYPFGPVAVLVLIALVEFVALIVVW